MTSRDTAGRPSVIQASRIVDRLKHGGSPLTGEELREIKWGLRQSAPCDLYDLAGALALGAPATPENVALVDQWLYRTDDDWDIQGLLYALCDYWRLTRNYLPYLVDLLSLDSWQGKPSAAIAAFGAVGDEAHHTQDPALFKSLLESLDRDVALASTGPDDFTFQHLALCYSALARGLKGRKALLERHRFESIDDIDLELVYQARQIAANA